MWSTGEVLRLVASVPLALLFALLVRDHRDDRSARATLFFLTCSIGNALAPLFPAERGGPFLAEVLFLLSCLVAASFWVLTKVHFDDDFHLGSGQLALLTLTTLVSWLCWLGLRGGLPGAWASSAPPTLFALLPKVIGLGFIVHALLTLYVGTRSDLVVSRMKLRYPIIWLTGTYIFLKLLSDAVVLGTPVQAPAEQVGDLVRFLLVVGIITVSLRVRPDFLRPPRVEADAPVLDPRLASDLSRLVEEERIYRQEGLTIGALAQRLATHEHKVRELINDQLGFRNFNAFLNHYRITEAQHLLADPEARHRNVAEVAFEVGFRSLGPFNKAFKDATGRTPTEFRGVRLG
jgi:AraC-like DNA-binding protein